MRITASRTIPKVSDEGIVNIGPAEWLDLAKVVTHKFQGELAVHEHAAGSHHGRSAVPVPHYVVEIELDDRALPRMLAVVHPLIEDIVRRSLSPAVPAHR